MKTMAETGPQDRRFSCIIVCNFTTTLRRVKSRPRELGDWRLVLEKCESGMFVGMAAVGPCSANILDHATRPREW